MAKYALTTSDNPYNPFDDFDRWYDFDEQMHYCSSELLVRIAILSSGSPISFEDDEISYAIDRIIKNIPVNTDKENVFYVKAINGITKFPIIKEQKSVVE